MYLDSSVESYNLMPLFPVILALVLQPSFEFVCSKKRKLCWILISDVHTVMFTHKNAWILLSYNHNTEHVAST